VPETRAGSPCCSTLKIKPVSQNHIRLQVRAGQSLIAGAVSSFPYAAHFFRKSLANPYESALAVCGMACAKVLVREIRVTTKNKTTNKTKTSDLMNSFLPLRETLFQPSFLSPCLGTQRPTSAAYSCGYEILTSLGLLPANRVEFVPSPSPEHRHCSPLSSPGRRRRCRCAAVLEIPPVGSAKRAVRFKPLL